MTQFIFWVESGCKLPESQFLKYWFSLQDTVGTKVKSTRQATIWSCGKIFKENGWEARRVEKDQLLEIKVKALRRVGPRSRQLAVCLAWNLLKLLNSPQLRYPSKNLQRVTSDVRTSVRILFSILVSVEGSSEGAGPPLRDSSFKLKSRLSCIVCSQPVLTLQKRPLNSWSKLYSC